MMRVRRILGFTALGAIAVVLLAALTLLFPDPLARLLVRESVADPFSSALAPEIRVSRHTLAGLNVLFGAAGGERAAAVTLGRTILIHPDVARRPDLLRMVIAHELGHVEQAHHLGPFYLPRYIAGFRPGRYHAHAMEIEASLFADSLLRTSNP